MSSQKYFRKFVIFVVVVFTAVFLNITAQAQVVEPLVPARLDPERFEPTPYLETETISIPSSRPESPNVTTWGKVVFQSYRDNNWEIYTMDDNGENQRRLTNQAKSDIHPRFNRGNTLIAFASNRDGDYEIYVMNADGSGLRQLTNNTTDDVNPTWSFDGTKLAFQAYRDGQSEVYTMKSDGTAQTRLTTNSAYEGTPSWSPDGQKIAFVSNRSGGYRIYVMNAQTGGGQTQLSNQPNSFNPTWSPDGTKIAYDADGDSDGWQDVWIMDSDGSNQIARYNPSGQVDAWVRNWFGKYLISFTEISFIQYQGVWYWTQAVASYTRFDDPYGVHKFSLTEKTDWNPDWQTSDAIPPTSSIVQSHVYVKQEILGLPFYSAACYSVYDSGGSGAYLVEVEYKHENDPNWQFFENLYLEDSLCRYFSPAQSLGDNRFGWFEFRGRATDNSFNFEAWPSGVEFRILIYEWRIDATTQDVRGNYLENVKLSIPDILEQTANPNSKEQTYYFAEPILPTTGWSSNGFLSLPETTYFLDFNYLVNTDIYLPPADNLIADWGFESNNLALAWGGSSAATLEAYHSGQVSAPFDATNRAISQSVTIPGNMTNPTLSFMYMSKFTWMEEKLLVTVQDGAVQTTFPFTTTSNWQQSWIDMSPWLGKTVTIRFMNETPDDVFYLDEVTLGSTYPNVWVDLAGELAALPGEQLTYEIAFGNSTNLDALTNTISLTLPTQVNFVSASMPPTVNGNVLTWQVGDLLADTDASSITVTTTVKAAAPRRTMLEAQVAIGSSTQELVLENNTAVFSTFVGDLVYLPFVTHN